MIDGEPGLPHGNLDRPGKGGLADQPDIRFQGKPEISEALYNAAVAPDKGDFGVLARLEGSDRYQGLFAGTGRGRRIFMETG